MVVVYRHAPAGIEYLILHRAHHGPDYEGDWAWTPPSGARQPGEPIEVCAMRELYEEVGLQVPVRRVNGESAEWAIYLAEVEPEETIRLHDREHDRFEWVDLNTALSRCRPVKVSDGIALAARNIAPAQTGA